MAAHGEACKIERSFDLLNVQPRLVAGHFLRETGSLRQINVTDASALRKTSRALQKGLQTRANILEAALALATHKGLEGLSIGVLAEATGMSKSGVFAHFGSREELQISVVREYHVKFEEEVFLPAIREPRGLPRLRVLFERWVRRVSFEIDSGCIYISGAVEFDDRPGPVRDALATMVQTWQDALMRAIQIAIDESHLSAATAPQQLMFEIHGLILALHHDARFMRSPGAVDRARRGFERLVACAMKNPSDNVSGATLLPSRETPVPPR